MSAISRDAKTARLQRKAMVHVHNVTRYRSGHQALVNDYPILAKTEMSNGIF